MTERLPFADWLDKHRSKTYDLLGKYYQWYMAAISQKKSSANLEFYDFQHRELSEMPLCVSHVTIAFELGLPADFHLTIGRVKTDPLLTQGRTYFDHNFFANDDEEIVDFTAAQFMQGKKPGERVKRLKARADDLVHVLPSGLVVLNGERRKIAQRIGVEYFCDTRVF